MSRKGFWEDGETGRRGFFSEKSPIPDGALVDEISAFEFYTRESHSLSCGWPQVHHPDDNSICSCGFIFPAHAPPHWHKSADDEALG